MFTVKHTLSNGAETIYAAEYATFDFGKMGEQAFITIYQKHPHPPFSIRSGMVEVINDAGNVSARYELNCQPSQTISAPARLHS